MKKRMFFVLAGLMLTAFSFAQTDSIVTFSDLKFHSAIEKKAYTNFVQYQTDTLEAFLAVDDILSLEDAVYLRKKFEDICKELSAKKIEKKKINAQIKLAYTLVKTNCFKTYVQEEVLSSTLLNGRYNEVTATILLALIFDRLHVPYLILDSSEEFCMIANPGPDEQKLEVGNPVHVTIEQTAEFKKTYVDFLRKTKKISDAEIRSHTFIELYDEKSKEQRQITLKELLGLLYYFQSGRKLGLENVNSSLEMIQKGFYLYQTPYVQLLYLNILAKKMEQFTVTNASDIDYLVQLYRVGNLDAEMTNNIFKNVISNQLEYTDREGLCDSLFERFTSKVHEQELLDEATFSFNLMRVNQKVPIYSDIFRIDKAACIKPNLKEVNDYLNGVIVMNLYKIQSNQARLDSIRSLSKQLKSAVALETLGSQRLTFLLQMAREAYKNKKLKEGEKFLLEFEASCPAPIGNDKLRYEVESAFHDIAVSLYWSTNMNVDANHKMIQRGLKFAPDSEMIKSGSYDKGNDQRVNTNPIVKVKNKTEDNTPKTGRSIRVISKDKKETIYKF